MQRNSKTVRKRRVPVKIIPLGGLDQIGQNMTVIECEDEILIVDCGLAFPETDMLGIDLIIPNFDYLRKNKEKIRGVVLTHGHEDHIGSLPYFLREFYVPVYGTRLTIGLVENKMKEFGLKNYSLTTVKPGDVVTLGCFKTEFIRTNHSIGDAAALAITTPAGVLFHTGDFKVDYTPIHGSMIDLQRIADLGRHKVLAMMSDSTNAERKGYTMSERTVGRMFKDTFDKAEGRILVATFASNVDRVQQIIDAARECGRRVVVTGRSMVNVINTAMELGYFKLPDGDDIFIDMEDIGQYDDNELVIVTTGSQGEPMAALSRMASGEHKSIEIRPGDTVIFSSRPVPGNEKTVSRVIDDLMSRGAKVISEDTHVSGHASQEELKLIYSLIQPKYFIPVHGEYRHLRRHADVIEGLGHDMRNMFLLRNGNILELDSYSGKIAGDVEVEPLLVDGLGVGDVGNIVLRDRKNLSENGLLIVVMTLRRQTGELMAGPDIVSRGFVYVRESEELMESCRMVVLNALAACKEQHITDWGSIKNEIRDSLRDYLWREKKRSPVILPIIMEVR